MSPTASFHDLGCVDLENSHHLGINVEELKHRPQGVPAKGEKGDLEGGSPEGGDPAENAFYFRGALVPLQHPCFLASEMAPPQFSH